MFIALRKIKSGLGSSCWGPKSAPIRGKPVCALLFLLAPWPAFVQDAPKADPIVLEAGVKNVSLGDLAPDRPAAPARSFPAAPPPLSVTDALAVMDEMSRRLGSAQPGFLEENARYVLATLNSLMTYIRSVDDANPTLPYYQWYMVDRHQANLDPDPDQTDTDEFRPTRSIPHVTAVGLRVTRGTVWIEKLVAYDKGGAAFEFNNIRKVIAGNRPHREVCFLDTEIELERVEIVYRGLDGEGLKHPRVWLEAGISSLPEYGKETIYRLGLARLAVEKKDLARAGKNLQEAIKSLTAYRKSRRL